MKNIIKKKELMPLIIAASLGIIFGVIYYFLLSKVDKMTVKESILKYINIINNKEIIKNTLISIVLTFSIISLSSTSIYLSPVIVIINFYKGMQFGFKTILLITIYKIGSLKYILSLMPKDIILLVLIIVYSTINLKYTNSLIKLIKERKSLDIRLYFKRKIILFLIFMIVSIVLSSFCTLISTYFVPKI